MSDVNSGQILINTEAMQRVAKYTMELKQKLEAITEERKEANCFFVSNSAGKFAQTFGKRSAAFEKRLQEQVEVLNQVELQASDTLKLQTELDDKIAQTMTLGGE